MSVNGYGRIVRLVGLTGGIGSGKSTVSGLLEGYGAVIVDADRIAREVVEPGGSAYDAVLVRFGADVRSADGSIDRPALADVVFRDPAALADLNAIVHPAVGVMIAERTAAHAGTDDTVVLDVPLLVETGRAGVQGVLVVDCDPEVAVRRLVELRGMDEADARRRMANQASREERLARADVVIDNSGDLAHLAAEVERAWRWVAALPPI